MAALDAVAESLPPGEEPSDAVKHALVELQHDIQEVRSSGLLMFCQQRVRSSASACCSTTHRRCAAAACSAVAACVLSAVCKLVSFSLLQEGTGLGAC